MKNNIIIFICLFLFISCKNHKENLVGLIKSWQGKKIEYTNQVKKLTINDSLMVNYDYKILHYVDSCGCFSCKLHWFEWKKFISDLDSVPVMFVFVPKSCKQMKRILKGEKFSYPYCIDMSDSLNILNKFPANYRFHTFLLGANNQVLVTGDPIENNKIRELYLNVLSNKIPIDSVSGVKSEILLSSSQHDFKEFDFKKKQKTFFYIFNKGKKPLVIFDIKTSCGCTMVSYSKEPIKPNEKREIIVTYKAEKLGYFKKKIFVHSNGSKFPIQFSVLGRAISL